MAFWLSIAMLASGLLKVSATQQRSWWMLRLEMPSEQLSLSQKV
jgi:hypothetical protein